MKNHYELEECPICRGAGFITSEGDWSVQVECNDCSAHTVYVEYSTDEEKAEAEKKKLRHSWRPITRHGQGILPRR